MLGRGTEGCQLFGRAFQQACGVAWRLGLGSRGGLVGVEPDVSDEALRQLKFAELLPRDLARDTLAVRAADNPAAARVAAHRISGARRLTCPALKG
jgi:hypothetical protein